MNQKHKITILLLLVLSSVTVYISGIIAVTDIYVSLFIYSVIFYLIVGTGKKIFKKQFVFFSKDNFVDFFVVFLYRAIIAIYMIIIFIGGFVYYELVLHPAKMPVYTISNGEKTVVFHTMSHIASHKFYNQVKDNISNLKKNNYVLYYEGVKGGTKENKLAFDKALGVKIDHDTYENMSSLYGLTHQDNSLFLGLINKLDYNIDTNIDDIMNIYRQKPSNKQEIQAIDTSNIVKTYLQSLNNKELFIIQTINKALINEVITNKNIQSLASTSFANKELFDIILGKRNEILADYIANSADKNIVTTYGLLHFDGVLEILQKKDNKWKIIKTDFIYILK